MSFNVKINRVKLYINGKNAETIKGNLQIRIGKHASNEKKAVFYICDNKTRKKEFYIPVVESQYSDVTGKRDNSSFYFTFKMEENTNDYKCILQGSKKNLEEIQKYIENFDSSMLNQIPNNESPSAMKNNDENEMSNATNKKKRKNYISPAMKWVRHEKIRLAMSDRRLKQTQIDMNNAEKRLCILRINVNTVENEPRKGSKKGPN